jgi:DHA1 family inner membrane transport protein
MSAATTKCTMCHYPPITVILVLWLTGLGAAAQFAKVGLVLPELVQMYPNAGNSLGFLVSSISFVGALLGLFAGSLAANIGLRKLLLAGLVLGSAVSLFQSMGLSISLLLASRIVEGVAHLAIVVSAPTLVALSSSDRMRAAAMTLWGSFFGVSYALTALIGLPLVAEHGVNTLFFTHGVLMAAAALLVLVVVPARKTEDAKGSAASLNLSTIFRYHKAAWSSPFVAAPAAGWLFYTLTFVALLTVLPGMMPPEDRSFTATVIPLASILSSMTIGVLLLQWLSAVLVIQIGLVAAICMALILALMPETPWPAIALFAALGLMQGATFAAVPQLNPSANQQALANGALAQAGNVGNALGTPLLLMLLVVGGFKSVIAMVMVCYVTAICAHRVLARRRGL